jgi:hypothetical protein
MDRKKLRTLDPGTGNLKMAWFDADGATVKTAKLRNVFFEVPNDDFSRKMLSNLHVAEFEVSGKLYVAGDEAYELAKTFGKPLRRPMKQGVISPGESDAIPMIGKMIERLMKTPGAHPGDQSPVIYSCPADPIDMTFDAVFHRSVVEGILIRLGYWPKMILEGHAVVLAELAADDFTGIGISCGGGMFNICVAYKSVPVITFATSRSGDYIDEKASTVCADVAPRLTAAKENPEFNLADPNLTSREELALETYYRDVIRYTLENIKRRFESGRDMPKFSSPVSIVCGGGTASIKGFAEVFKRVFESLKFPIPVKEIRVAPDPLFCVSRGCLIASSLL